MAMDDIWYASLSSTIKRQRVHEIENVIPQVGLRFKKLLCTILMVFINQILVK